MQPIKEKQEPIPHRAICYDNEGTLDCVCILQHEQDERS